MDTTLECYTGLFTNCGVLSSRQNYYFQNPWLNPPLTAVLALLPSESGRHPVICRICRCHSCHALHPFAATHPETLRLLASKKHSPGSSFGTVYRAPTAAG